MISEAIKSQLSNVKTVSSDLRTIRWTDSEKRLRYIYLTPQSVAEAIVAFDQGIKPKPFTFQLRTAVQITRGPSGRAKPNDEKQQLKETNERIRRQVIASNATAPFSTPEARRAQIIEAMRDPNANLGPPTALVPPAGNPSTSIPTIVGGKPPRLANLAKSRRFGLRLLMP